MGVSVHSALYAHRFSAYVMDPVRYRSYRACPSGNRLSEALALQAEAALAWLYPRSTCQPSRIHVGAVLYLLGRDSLKRYHGLLVIAAVCHCDCVLASMAASSASLYHAAPERSAQRRDVKNE